MPHIASVLSLDIEIIMIQCGVHSHVPCTLACPTCSFGKKSQLSMHVWLDTRDACVLCFHMFVLWDI